MEEEDSTGSTDIRSTGNSLATGRGNLGRIRQICNDGLKLVEKQKHKSIYVNRI